jgi:hypothetical protein
VTVTFNQTISQATTYLPSCNGTTAVGSYATPKQISLSVPDHRSAQKFAREMERQRTSAAEALEAFKADLVLRAEVRRRVAELKVEAVRRRGSAARRLADCGA